MLELQVAQVYSIQPKLDIQNINDIRSNFWVVLKSQD